MCEEGPPRGEFSFLALALGNKHYSPFYSPQHRAGGVLITTQAFEFPLTAVFSNCGGGISPYCLAPRIQMWES